jgi:hypothetical protein
VGVNEAIHLAFTDFKNKYDLTLRELLHKILSEFGIAIKVLQLIQMHLNRTYDKVIGFEGLTAVVVKSTTFWDIMLCSPL